MPDITPTTYTAESFTAEIVDAASYLEDYDESKVVAYVNGKVYPVISIENDEDEGWVVLNIGTKEVQREA